MIDPSPPRSARRSGAVVAVALSLALVLGACGGGGDDGGSGDEGAADRPATTEAVTAGEPVDESPTTDDGPAEPTIDCPVPEGDLAVFGADVVVVVPADGPPVERCVLVADRAGRRSQGLMGVTDLGPYDGMVFAYAGTSTGGYWMKDTPMPLTIAWIGVDGDVVATADMEPCLDRGSSCPDHSPGAEYRWALEVPQGRLGAFGLTDGAVLDVDSLPVGLD